MSGHNIGGVFTCYAALAASSAQNFRRMASPGGRNAAIYSPKRPVLPFNYLARNALLRPVLCHLNCLREIHCQFIRKVAEGRLRWRERTTKAGQSERRKSFCLNKSAARKAGGGRGAQQYKFFLPNGLGHFDSWFDCYGSDPNPFPNRLQNF